MCDTWIPDRWRKTANVRDVARILDVSERTVRRIISRGDLPAIVVGGQYRVVQDDLVRYIVKNTTGGAR